MTDTPTIAELRRRAQEERAALDAVVAALPTTHLETPGVEGDWTVKDTLAHILWWEQYMIDRVASALALDTPRVTAPLFHQEVQRDGSDAWVDEVNSRVYAHFKTQSLQAVQQQYAESGRAVAALLDTLTDDTLSESGPLAQALGYAPIDLLIGDTYGHYEEHRHTIEMWATH